MKRGLLLCGESHVNENPPLRTNLKVDYARDLAKLTEKSSVHEMGFFGIVEVLIPALVFIAVPLLPFVENCT